MAKVLRRMRDIEGTRRGWATRTSGTAHGGSIGGACRQPMGLGKGHVGVDVKRGRCCYNGGMRGSSEMEG
jgi:hypothetical protein